MRHLKSFRKFNRSVSHRRAMFRNMATSLLEHGQIETTLERAKDLRPQVEKYITIAGSDTLHNRRKALSYFKSKKVVHTLFAEIGPKYRERPGGYTRVIRTGLRSGDAGQLAVIQLIDDPYEPSKKKKKKTKATTPELKKSKKKAEEGSNTKNTDTKNASGSDEGSSDRDGKQKEKAKAVETEAPLKETAEEENKK